jgi:hypothetical protein
VRKSIQWPGAILATTVCLTFTGPAFAQTRVTRLINDPANLHTPSDLTYHGGAVMTGAKHYRLIFYGDATWTLAAYPIVRDWASGYTQTPPSLSNILTQYPKGTIPFKDAVTLSTVGNDVGAVFYGYTHGAHLSDVLVQLIVMDAITSGQMALDDKAVYFVLTSPDVTDISISGAFCISYCGYHGNFSFMGKDLKYAFVGDASTQCLMACVALNTVTSPNGNVGVDGMLNVMSHEGAEAFTDPDDFTGPFGWYDGITGDEIGDKCNFTFGTVSTGGPGFWNQSWAGRKYLLQELWDNSTSSCKQTK